jgi:hypothetical protein
MGRTLVVFFLFVNLVLCFYVAYELFRTADFLAETFKGIVNALALVGTSIPDFNELKALGVYVVLLGISGFAIAYWIYEDEKNISRLQRLRKLSIRAKAQVKPTVTEREGIQLLECPECGEELEEDFEVCPKCGYELKPVKCPKCGKEISRTFNFCPYCGNEMPKNNI